ncbi:MAG: hypothetical protein OXQ28_11090 [Acidobacteriota bacterium]|nr:hypothetical protein [Acidobacteriota bacterium]
MHGAQLAVDTDLPPLLPASEIADVLNQIRHRSDDFEHCRVELGS